MKKATIDRKNNLITIKFSLYDRKEWQETLKNVKRLDGWDFKAKQKKWLAPATDKNIIRLRKYDFELLGDIPQKPKSNAPQSNPWSSIEVPTEKFPDLYSYQIECLKFLKWRGGRAIIGDEMGTGKTVQALSYLKLFPEKRPALIVCPSSIKLQWQKEYEVWAGDEFVPVLSGRTPHELDPTKSYIINWDILSHKLKQSDGSGVENGWIIELLKVPFKVIIGDEIQVLGNHRSNRSSVFKKLVKKTPEFIGMSGTPIRSRPYQFFTALNLVAPKLFSNRWKFYERYCNLRNNGFGWDYNGVSRPDELHGIVKNLMIRRLKNEVAKHLPPKIRSMIPLNPEKPKITEVIKWIENFLESDLKLVVFAWHIEVVDTIHKKFSDIAVKLYGGTTTLNKDKAIQSFINNKKIQLFIGNIQAAGVGVDGLQHVCSHAAFAEFSYIPKDIEQAEARVHREGSKKPVNLYYLYTPGNEDDENFINIIDSKNKMIDHVVDGEKTDDSKLLKKIRNKDAEKRKDRLI